LPASPQSLLTTTHKTTAINAAPSLKAHMTKKDKTVIKGKDSVLKQSTDNRVETSVLKIKSVVEIELVFSRLM
jgi:hypothetical protein